MNDLHQLVLSSLIACPLVGALLVALLPRRIARESALVFALVTFVLSLHLPANWERLTASAQGFRFEQNLPWLPQFGATYHLGVDGLSVFLVLLTTFLTPLVLLGAWREIATRVKEFAVCILLLEAAAVGVFCALDAILFYVFWEAVLIPMFLLMLGWGGARRNYAAIKFFVYTMVGSVLMWIAILYVYLQQTPGARSFDYAPFQAAARAIDSGNPVIAMWLFAAFALAFAIKVPVFPFHSWQPEAYAESPTAGTVMLAAVLSKMGAYGFIRFAVALFPNAARDAAPLMIALALISIVYGALVAIRQTDFKRLLAYSSVSHLGFIVLGIFVALLARQNQEIALSGATLQMVSHGLSTAALFLLVGILFERRATRTINQFGGLAATMPRYTVLFWIALFASIGLPGLSGFVGEYLILQGTMAVDFGYAAIAASGVIWGAVYMLRMFRTLMFGEITREENKVLSDVTRREWAVLAVILAVVVWIGVAPQPFLDVINPSARHVASLAQQTAPESTLSLAQR